MNPKEHSLFNPLPWTLTIKVGVALGWYTPKFVAIMFCTFWNTFPHDMILKRTVPDYNKQNH